MSGSRLFGVLENFGSGELVAIALIALVFLGPDRIPEMARGLGRLIHKVRTMTEGLQGEVSSVMNDPAMKPLRELGEFAARPRQKLTEYALEAEAEARAKREQESQDAADAQIEERSDDAGVLGDGDASETPAGQIGPAGPSEPTDDLDEDDRTGESDADRVAGADGAAGANGAAGADAAAGPDAHTVKQAEARLRSLAAQTATEPSPGSSTPGQGSEPD